MARSYKARNKRIIMRSGNGRFRETTAADFGIGVCPNDGCNHLTLQVFDRPGGFPRQRCFTCEPKTEAELEVDRLREEEEANTKSPFLQAIEDAAKELEGRKDRPMNYSQGPDREAITATG